MRHVKECANFPFILLSVTKRKLFGTQIGLNEREFMHIRYYRIKDFIISLSCKFASSEWLPSFIIHINNLNATFSSPIHFSIQFIFRKHRVNENLIVS